MSAPLDVLDAAHRTKVVVTDKGWVGELIRVYKGSHRGVVRLASGTCITRPLDGLERAVTAPRNSTLICETNREDLAAETAAANRPSSIVKRGGTYEVWRLGS